MKSPLFLSAVCLATLAPAVLAAEPARPIAQSQLATKAKASLPPIPFSQYRLPNGLRVILHEDHSAPVVSVNVWYHVGSKNERLGRTGFAHLFEHMMFQGSKNYDDDFFKPLQEAGGQVNGSTSSDRTNYFSTVPANFLERALFLEADRMGGLLPAMTAAKFQNQREVVKNEKRQNYDNRPYGRAGEVVAEALYPANHPYHWLTIGSMQDLDDATLDDVKAFFRTYYVPNNASLVVAGDFEPKQAKTWIAQYFGPVPRGKAVPPVKVPGVKLAGEKRLTMPDRVTLPRVSFTWPTVKMFAPDDAVLDVLADVLAGGKSSRLYKSLVYDKQIAQSVSAYHYSRELGGEFSIVATARPGHTLQELEAAIETELALIQRELPTADEMTRAFNEREASFVYSLQTVGGFGSKSDQLNFYATERNDPGYFQKDLNRYAGLRAIDVRRVAQRYLGANRIVLSVVPQAEAKPDAAPAPVAQTVSPASPSGAQPQNKVAAPVGATAAPAGTAPVAANAPDVAPSKPQDPNANLPAPAADPSVRLPQIQRRTLPNGLQVLLVEQHELPVVTLNLVVKTGSEADPRGREGLASLAASLLDEGTKTRSALEISDQLAGIGASLSTRGGWDGSSASLLTLKRHLPRALDIMADVALNPSFPPEELERTRASLLASLRARRDSADQVADVVLARVLYGADHPYGHPTNGDEASAKAISRDDVLGFYAKFYHPNNAALIVVGDAKLDEMMPLLEQAFGAWQPGDVPQVDVSAPTATGPRVVLVDKPGAAQSVVSVAQIGLPRSTPDFFPLRVLNTALGGQFTSRVNLNLREDKGYTYGAYTGWDFRRGAGPFEAGAGVQTDVTAPAVRELQKELSEVRQSRPLSTPELEAARSALIRAFGNGFETPSQIAARLEAVVLYGLPDDYFDTYIDRIRAVSSQDVARVAQQHLDPQTMTILVVGDREKVEAGLREFGAVTVVDAEGAAAVDSRPALAPGQDGEAKQ